MQKVLLGALFFFLLRICKKICKHNQEVVHFLCPDFGTILGCLEIDCKDSKL